MPSGLKGHSTGDSIRRPCFQLMQSYSVNTAPVLYCIILLIAVAFERALLKPKYPKGRLASLILTQDVGRAYHFLPFWLWEHLEDYFLRKARSFKTLLPSSHHRYHHCIVTATRPIESSNYGQGIKVCSYYSGHLFRSTSVLGCFIVLWSGAMTSSFHYSKTVEQVIFSSSLRISLLSYIFEAPFPQSFLWFCDIRISP